MGFYPPIGLASVSFTGLASYVVLVGIYYSAISFAHDVAPRQSIRKSAIKDSKLLDTIGKSTLKDIMSSPLVTTDALSPAVLAVKKSGSSISYGPR